MADEETIGLAIRMSSSDLDRDVQVAQAKIAKLSSTEFTIKTNLKQATADLDEFAAKLSRVIAVMGQGAPIRSLEQEKAALEGIYQQRQKILALEEAEQQQSSSRKALPSGGGNLPAQKIPVEADTAKAEEGLERVKGKLKDLGESGGHNLALAFEGVTLAIELLKRAAEGAYDLLIGKNAELQKNILSTQVSIASTNKVIQDGVEIKDPTAAVKALEGPVTEAIKNIRIQSDNLVGVTSANVIPLFQTIAGQASRINATIEQSADLSVKFAAAAQTVNIPLDQANIFTREILSGQITSENRLATALHLNASNVEQYRQQGTLVKELNSSLEVFIKGNALGAQQLGGVTSNIVERFDEIARVAGEPILAALVKELNQVFEYVKANQDAFKEFAQQGSEEFLEFVSAIAESGKEITDALAPAIKDLGPAAGETAKFLADGFKALAATLAALAPFMAQVVEKLNSIYEKAKGIVQKAQEGIGLLTGATNDSHEAVSSDSDTSYALTGQSIQLEQKLKDAINARNKAKAEGRGLTAEETKAEKEAQQQKDQLLAQLKGELAVVNQRVAIGDDDRRTNEETKKSLEARINALNKDSEALGKNASNIKLVANANQAALPPLQRLQQAIEAQEAAAKLTDTNAQTAIQKQVNAEVITKAEGEKEKLQAAQTRIAEELKAEESKLSQLEAMPKSDDPKAEADRQKEILGTKQKIGDLGLQAEQNIAQQRETVERNSLNEIQKANEKTQAAIENSQNARLANVKQAILSGKLSEEQAAIESAKIAETSAEKEYQLKKDELAKVENARKSGSITAETAAKQELQLNQEIGKANLSRLDAEIAAQKALKAEQVKAIEVAADASLVKKKQLLLDRKETEEQFAAASAKINATKAEEEYRLTVSYAKQGKASLEEVTKANLARLDAEIAAQRALRAEQQKTLNDAVEAKKAPIEQNSADLTSSSTTLKNENDLLSARLRTSNALYSLDQGRLEFAISTAKASGDEAGAARLQQQLFASQNAQLAEQQRIKAAITRAEDEQKLNQAAIAINQAKINVLAAQEAVSDAEIAGKSKNEIQRLQEKADLAGQTLDLTQKSFGFQQQINAENEKAQTAEDKAAQQKQRNQEAEAQRQKTLHNQKMENVQTEKKANDELSGQVEKGIDRQIQLEFAKNNRDRERLQKQFEQEDKQAARRAQLEAQVRAANPRYDDGPGTGHDFGGVSPLTQGSGKDFGLGTAPNVNPAGGVVQSKNGAAPSAQGGFEASIARLGETFKTEIGGLKSTLVQLLGRPSTLNVMAPAPLQSAAKVWRDISSDQVGAPGGV